MRPFGRFARPYGERCSAPQICRPFACLRVLRLWPRATNDLCSCVCKPAQRLGSANTWTGTFRDDAPSPPACLGARSCDTFERLHHGSVCRSAEGEELPSEASPYSGFSESHAPRKPTGGRLPSGSMATSAKRPRPRIPRSKHGTRECRSGGVRPCRGPPENHRVEECRERSLRRSRE